MRLIKNKLLVDITDKLKEIDIRFLNFDEAFERDKRHYKRKKYAVKNFHGYFGETCLALALQKICKPYVLSRRVIFNPIKSGTLEGKYYFRENYGNVIAKFSYSGRTIAEYDQLLIVDKTPVLFEIRMSYWKAGRGMKDLLFWETLQKKLEPLLTYFNKLCGYVVVGSKDGIKMDSTLTEMFLKHNGILAPLNITLEDFVKESKIAKEYFDL